MRKIISTLMLATLATACTASSPDDTGSRPGDVPPVYDVPGGGVATSMLGGASFQMTGETAEGTASFTSTPITDENSEPTSIGAGELYITVDQQNYSAPTLKSFGFLVDEPSGYVVLVGIAERTGSLGASVIDQVVVVVPKSDVTAGTTVELDGIDRVAFFASGDPESPAPTVYAAAVTGEVTFFDGPALNGGTLSANVRGDFGSIEWVDEEPSPNPGTLTDGSYTLSIDSTADIYCDGSLEGQEAAFAGITPADLGFTDGSISITDGGTMLAGSTIAGAFGASSIVLEVEDDAFLASRARGDAGPAGSTLHSTAIVLDGAYASPTFVSGAIGGFYEFNDDGSCSVMFSSSLSAL